MDSKPILAALCAAFLLAGCGPKPSDVKPAPDVVKVPVPTYVPIPASMTARCRVPKLAESNGDLTDLAHAFVAAFEKCNVKLDTIGKVQGSPVPSK